MSKNNPTLTKNKDQKTSQTQSKVELVKPIDLNENIERERQEAYVDPKTRELLRDLIQYQEKAEIIPIYSPNLGFIYQTTKKNPNQAELGDISKEFLENLARLDILQADFYDSISVCPDCQSTIITLHVRCPKCKSHDVDKISLTEHVPCGFIDQRNKYIGNICPKCKEKLVEGEYRNMGRWYVCKDCSERFEDPGYDLICRNCAKTFAFKDAQLKNIYKFSLNQNRKKEIRQNVASLESLQQLLIDLGFNVEIPGIAVGEKSGIRHQFSLIAKKQIDNQELTIALDHAISEPEVSSSPLILYIYKTSEIKVDIPIFVAMPQMNETAKKIAQGHNILLIEGSIYKKEEIERIKNEIEYRLNIKSVESQEDKAKIQKSSLADKIGKSFKFKK